jgi:hypothetical protein
MRVNVNMVDNNGIEQQITDVDLGRHFNGLDADQMEVLINGIVGQLQLTFEYGLNDNNTWKKVS